MHAHLTLRSARALSLVVAAFAVTWTFVLAGCQGGRLASRVGFQNLSPLTSRVSQNLSPLG
ncbi:MAG: hypothetical protein OHK0013_40710 [Sandaracinaceae bacterium]